MNENQPVAVGVHCGSPLMLALPEMFPAGNVWVTHVLRRLLWLALLRADLMTEAEPGGIGPLNDCVMPFIVTDGTAAVEIIKEELEQIRLLDYCQIGVSDDGVNWHGVHPHSDTPMLWLMSMERQELWLEQFKKQSERRGQFLRGQGPNPDSAQEGGKK
jgi:hypothetical protein